MCGRQSGNETVAFFSNLPLRLHIHLKNQLAPWNCHLGISNINSWLHLGKSDNRSIKNHYQCGQCMKKFSRRDHLRTHEKNIHGEFAGPFKCGICSQLYKNTESLRKHIAKFHFSTIHETIQRIEVNAWNESSSGSNSELDYWNLL